MDVRKRQPIGIELVKRGIVTEDDINSALQEQRMNPNKKIGEILKICYNFYERIVILCLILKMMIFYQPNN